jgi:hypothetical protein
VPRLAQYFGLMFGRESDSLVLGYESPMFFRLKKSGDRGYVQIVENKREGAAVRIAPPGVSSNSSPSQAMAR